MTADQHDDDALLASLRESTSGSSTEHDATVLAAARQVAKSRRQRSAAPWWRPFAVGLPVLAVVAVIGVSLLNETPPPPDTVRSPSVTVVPADGATVSELNAFSWQAVRGASEYRIVVRNEAANVVWESDWAGIDAEQNLPAFAPGVYLWTVQT
ncbi:MAG: hypothetical protein AAGC71_09790, partial [Pseudomonadota bacterium]